MALMEGVSLEGMNAKLIAKEYKLVAKTMKSKDDECKQSALDRFALDVRYLTEGGCMIPLLEAIQPKKKSLDFSRIAIKSLLSFLETKNVGADSAVSSLPALGLKAIYDSIGSLEPLQILSNLLVYKDEVKKVKEVKVKTKKGDAIPEPMPPPIIHESEFAIEIRRNSLRAMFCFAEALSTFPAFTAEETVGDLKRLFGTVADLAVNACEVLLQVSQRLASAGDDASVAEAAVREGVWAMECLTLVMRYNHDAAKIVLNSGLVEHLASLTMSEALKIYCLQVLDLLSINGPLCLQVVTQAANSSILLQAAESAASNMAQRERVLQMASVVKTLTLMVEQSGDVFENSDMVPRVVVAVSAVMQNAGVWEACKIPDNKQYDAPLLTFLNACCILLGSLAKISNVVRKEVCNSGSAALLLFILQHSSTIVGETPLPPFLSLPYEPLTAEETLALRTSRLGALRRVAEQALLFILTEVNARDKCERWTSCVEFTTDEALFSSEAASPFPSGLLFEVIGAPDDQDLNNRGIKILSALLQSSSDSKVFLDLLKIDAAGMVKVSVVVNALSLGLLEMSRSALASDDQDHDQTSQQQPSSALLQSTDRCTCSQAEALYHSLTVLEPMLHYSTENVVTFATPGRIQTLAKLLSSCGPSVASSALEMIVNLNDPRRLSWVLSAQSPDACLADDILLRPIIFDVLSIVAGADAKYRIYDGETPPVADAPLPASASPCAAEALLVCKMCSDPCIATLLCNIQYVFINGCAIAAPAQEAISAEQVLNAALRLQGALASCGQGGLETSLQAIADAGFMAEEQSPEVLVASSMTPLKIILGQIPITSDIPMASVEPGLEESAEAITEAATRVSALTAPYKWTRPSKFSDVFPGDGVPPSSPAILANPCMWPMVTFCSPLVGIIGNPKSSPETCRLAVRALQSTCRMPQLLDVSQTVTHDALTCAFLSVGGAVALLGAAGSFGNLSPEERGNAQRVASFILGRGRCREDFWSEFPATTGEDGVNRGADPNAGPSMEVWSILFQVISDDKHGRCASSFPLTAAIQNLLPDLAVQLIQNLAPVDMQDGACLCPLNYALVLGMADVTQALISAKADINKVDAEGHPMIAYSFLTLSPEDVSATFLPLSWDASLQEADVTRKLGSSSLVSLLLDAKVDILIADAKGCPPLMMAMGLAHKTLFIGGYNLEIRSSAYTDQCLKDDIIQVAGYLLNAGAAINFCNRSCVTALHIAAAQGHVEMIDLLLKNGAAPNAIDARGYLPIHYIAAACPDNAIIAFDRLLRGLSDHPLKRLTFEDFRTGKTDEEKIMVDIDGAFRNIFSAVLDPVAIKAARHNASTVILMRADNGMNVMQLCMCAHHLQEETFVPFLSGDKCQRMALAVWLMSAGDTKSLLSCCDGDGTNVLHSSSLLFQGVTEVRELSAAEKRSKRIKYYPSDELKLLDNIFKLSSDVGALINSSSTLVVKGIPRLPSSWTPLHAAIAADNSNLVALLLENGADVATPNTNFVHFLASCNAGPLVCEAIISACASCPSYNSLLHSVSQTGNPICEMTARPLHIAVRTRNIAATNVLVNCKRTDLNLRDDESGHTAIHEAVVRSDLQMLDIIASAADRIDLLVTDATGATCVDIAAEAMEDAVMSKLLLMRKNDVIERVLAMRGADRDSLLMQLEMENMRLCRMCGLGPRIESPGVISHEIGGDDEEKGDKVHVLGTEKAKEVTEVTERGIWAEEDGPMGEEKEIIVKDIEVSILVPPATPEKPTVSAHELEMLRKSDNMVSLLIGAVQGLVGPDVHCHVCFYEGKLYNDAQE